MVSVPVWPTTAPSGWKRGMGLDCVDRGETASGESKEYRFAVSLQRIAETATIDEATWRSTCPSQLS